MISELAEHTIIKLILVTNLIYLSLVTVAHESVKSSSWSSRRKEQIKAWENTVESSDYHAIALDSRKVHRLFMLERKLVASLQNLKKSKNKNQLEDSPCLMWMSKYLSEFEEDKKVYNHTSENTMADTQNPLLIFKMMRRMYLTLLAEVLNSCTTDMKNRKVATTVREAFKGAKLSLLTSDDWEDARVGVLRIQYIYGLDAVNELRHGIINGRNTGAYLGFEDCIALARKALELQANELAYQWLVSTDMSLAEKKYSPYCNIKLLEGEMITDVEYLRVVVNVTTLEEMDKLMNNQRQKVMAPFRKYDDYALCRGDTSESGSSLKNVPKFKIQPLSKCQYQRQWHPYFYINPVKTQLISYDPPVYQFYDFVSNEAMQVIRDIGSKNMVRLGKSNSKDRTQAPHELSHLRTTLATSSVNYENQPKVFRNLQKKIEKVAEVKLTERFASDWFMETHGALGGYYDRHHDSVQKKGAPIDDKGDRLATVLIFLSDVSIGGYTAFNRLDVFVVPVKGSAVMWFNLKPDLKRDDRVFYTECPVAYGIKDVAKLWINQYENMWSYPCENSSLVADVPSVTKLQ